MRQRAPSSGANSPPSGASTAKADGTAITAEVYTRALTHEGREAALVAVIDVTERMRTEDELRRTRAFLDAVVENIPAMLFVKDAKEHRYVLFNRAGEELLGVPRSELMAIENQMHGGGRAQRGSPRRPG